MIGNGANQNGNGRVSYAEVRRVARWLGMFTAQDLADALHVHEAVGEQFVKALLWHRLAHDTGEYLDLGPEPEPVYEMDPLPDRIYPRIRRLPPELEAVFSSGGFLLYNHRGITQHLDHDSTRRKRMSLPGERHRIKLREAARKRQEEAKEERARKQRAKAKEGA